MIFDRGLRGIFSRDAPKNDAGALTLDSVAGWRTGGSLAIGGGSGAMRLPAVNACVEIISDSVAKMPIHLMDSATRRRVSAHPVRTLLCTRPTPAMTAFDYHKLMEVNRIFYGNAYALILRDRWLQPAELLPLPPQSCTPFRDPQTGALWYIAQNPKTGEYRKFYPADILHYKAFSADGIIGISYLTRAREVLQTALQAQKYEGKFYQSGAQLSGVLSADTDLSGKPQQQPDGTSVSLKDKIRAEWERIYAGADNAFRIAVLDNGLKYTPISSTNRDAQFIESKTASVDDICRLFGVPAYKLGAGKQTYASNVQAAIEYITQTLSPIVIAHEQEDSYKLLTQGEQAAGLMLRRNMMGELRGDWAARGEWYTKMRDAGVFSVNDIRDLEDLPSVDGGDTRYASLNYIPLDRFDELSVARNGGTE